MRLCREEWHNFAPRAGETRDDYKARLGHIFSFSKSATGHTRIGYPSYFASAAPTRVRSMHPIAQGLGAAQVAGACPCQMQRERHRLHAWAWSLLQRLTGCASQQGNAASTSVAGLTWAGHDWIATCDMQRPCVMLS